MSSYIPFGMRWLAKSGNYIHRYLMDCLIVHFFPMAYGHHLSFTKCIFCYAKGIHSCMCIVVIAFLFQFTTSSISGICQIHSIGFIVLTVHITLSTVWLVYLI